VKIPFGFIKILYRERMKYVYLLFLSVLTGCSTSGKVEQSHLNQKLSGFKTPKVQVSFANPSLKGISETLGKKTEVALQKRKLFKSNGQDGLVVRLNVESYESGNKAVRMLNLGGESKLTVKGELWNEISQSKIGDFVLSGSSLREVQYSFNDIHLDGYGLLDDLQNKAVNSAVTYLLKYFEENLKN
jgi:hypothetical protein